MRIKRITAALLAGAFALGAAQQASAENLIEVPTNWRMENYVSSHAVTIWFSSAPNCNSGLKTTNFSEDDQNRLWSLILTAKVSNRKMGVFYDNANGVCEITSFYMDAG